MEKFDYTGRQAPRDDSLETYRIGGRVSHFVPLTASGGTRAELNAESLDLLVGFPTPSKEEEESVFGDVRVSLFTSGGAVFLILTTPTFTVDFSVNILCMKAEAIGHWLSSRSCAVKLIFVDSSDMTLRALRLLELPLMGEVRTVVRQQLEMSMAQVDCSIQEAMRQYTPMDMERMCSAKCEIQPISQKNEDSEQEGIGMKSAIFILVANASMIPLLVFYPRLLGYILGAYSVLSLLFETRFFIKPVTLIKTLNFLQLLVFVGFSLSLAFGWSAAAAWFAAAIFVHALVCDTMYFMHTTEKNTSDTVVHLTVTVISAILWWVLYLRL